MRSTEYSSAASVSRHPAAAVLTLWIATSVAAVAQKQPSPLNLPSAPSASSSAVTAPVQAPRSYPELKPYVSCSFPDGLQITDVTPMPDDVRQRPVQSHGVAKTVPLLAGRRVTFAYPGAQPYASAKVELLPPDNYVANRKLLLDDFDDIAASEKNATRNSARGATLSGFPVAGLDRNSITGNTLGIYLLFDDKTHIVTTVYLLNPPSSKFKSTADYSRARDTFLYNYTHCIRNNQSGALFGTAR